MVSITLIATAATSRAAAAEPWQVALRDTPGLPTDWITQSRDGSVAIDAAPGGTFDSPARGNSRPAEMQSRWFGELDWITPRTDAFASLWGTSRPLLFDEGLLDPPLDTDLTFVGLPSPLAVVTAPLGLLSGISGGRIRGEYLDDFDENSRSGGSLILDTVWRLGVDTEAYYWTEDDPAGGDRNLTSGDVNVIWQYGAGTPIRFQTGLGMNWLHMAGETEYGFNTTYGLDIQVRNWLAFGGSLDWGRVGGEELFHGRITTSYMVGLFEIYVGYDIYEVGWIEREGLIAGVGLWF